MKRIIEYIVITAISIVPFIRNFFSYCTNYSNMGFDSQTLFIWEYAASKNYIPFKEVFYPYGVLSFYKFAHLYAHITYFSLPSVLLISLYIVIKKITSNTIIPFIIILFLVSMSYRIIAFDALVRYGPLLLSSFLFPYIFKFKKGKPLYKALLGLYSGICISLVLDIGIFIVLQSIFLYIFIDKHKEVLRDIVYYIVGMLIGITPLVIVLISLDAFSSFISQLKYLSLLTYIAKTPFIPFSTSPANLFTFGVFLMSLIKVCIDIVIYKRKSIYTYIEVALLLSIFLLEQRSIIRSIDRITVLFSFSLLQIIVLDLLIGAIKQKRLLYVIYIFVQTLVIIVLFTIIPLGVMANKYSWDLNLSNLSVNNRVCIEGAIDDYEKEYVSVLSGKKELKDVFVFPSEPILYALTRSKLPYFLNSYDSSSLSGQKKQIAFLQNNNISTVLYNYSKLYSQDGVPDFIRNSLLHKYILNNYKIEKVSSKYIILTKKKNSDWFTDSQLPNLLHTTLSNVNFESIPMSEGFYKSSALIKNSQLVVSGRVKDINIYLKKNQVDSSHLYLHFTPSSYNSLVNLVTFRAELDLASKVQFAQCRKDNSCIIHLENLPLFYKKRIITSIEVSDKNSMVSLYKSNSDKLW